MKLSPTVVVVALVMLVIVLATVLFIGKIGDVPVDSVGKSGLFIASFCPQTYGSQFTGGSIVLVNPTEKDFENLTLTITVDDSELITPFLRSLKPLSIEAPFSNYSFLITQISIEPEQNMSIQLFLFDPQQNDPPFPQTIIDIQTFSPHVIRFYITKDALGDVINGQSFTISQEKAYLQIIDYSSIEHSTDTWHEYYNNSKKRYEYINDQPNFFQHSSAFFPLDPNSYSWAKALNQIGEHYYNVTILNNSTFPVKRITYSPNGEGSTMFGAVDMILQPNATYVLAVQTSGENWWSAKTVYELGTFSSDQTFASGDLLNNNE